MKKKKKNLWWSSFPKIVNDFKSLTIFAKALSKMFDKVLKAPLTMVKPKSSLSKIFLKICLR